MGTAPRYIFPGAVIGSVILCMLALSLTGALVAPIELNTDSNQLQLVGINENNVVQPLDASQTQPPICEISGRYPENIRQWCQLVTPHAHANGLDPDLVAALIWQESGGDPLAYSKSGAVGLMQVMPRDGIAASFECINGPCFANRPSIQELQDSSFNIEYGTQMLGGLQAKYGSLREALKYYGPKDVGYYYADKVLGIYNSYAE